MYGTYNKRRLPGDNLLTPYELYRLQEIGDLTLADVEYLWRLRERAHGFAYHRDLINHCSNMHYNEPGSIIFLDIKGTLYYSGTHSRGYGILGRSDVDAPPISTGDIIALGEMIDRTRSQKFTLPLYNFNNNFEIVPDESAVDTLLYEKKTLPNGIRTPMRVSQPKYYTKYGPFTVVFISSDDVKTQKCIISLLYYISLFIWKRNIFFPLSDCRATEIDIIKIEQLLKEKYDNDFMRFLEMEDANFAGLTREEIADFRQTIDGLFFMSVSETQKSKLQLMNEFLDSSLVHERHGWVYNVFALGDSCNLDGPMVLNAFERGGVGFMREDYDFYGSVALMKELSEKEINLCYFPTVKSFSEFYSHVIHRLLAQREEELLGAMKFANSSLGKSKKHAFRSNVPVNLQQKD